MSHDSLDSFLGNFSNNMKDGPLLESVVINLRTESQCAQKTVQYVRVVEVESRGTSEYKSVQIDLSYHQ